MNFQAAYDATDLVSQEMLKVVSGMPGMPIFLQACINECNKRLIGLGDLDPDKLVERYNQITTEKKLFEDMQFFLNNLTDGESDET